MMLYEFVKGSQSISQWHHLFLLRTLIVILQFADDYIVKCNKILNEALWF